MLADESNADDDIYDDDDDGDDNVNEAAMKLPERRVLKTS